MQIFYGDEPMRQPRTSYKTYAMNTKVVSRWYRAVNVFMMYYFPDEGNLNSYYHIPQKVQPWKLSSKSTGALVRRSNDTRWQLNDLSMLRFAGAGVAMGNGKPNIKVRRDTVTTDSNHQGVAKTIYSAIAYQTINCSRSSNHI